MLRDTLPEPTVGFGVGIAGQASTFDGTKSRVDVYESLIERSHNNGIIAAAADIVVDRSLVRETAPAIAGNGGTGIYAHGLEYGPSILTVLNSALTHNQGNGIGVLGDGIFLDFRGQPTSVFVHATRIERSARAASAASAASWR